MVGKPIIVYAASGYTGTLVAEALAETKQPFVATGRNQKKLDDLAASLKGADVEAVQVEHTVEALTKLFEGSKVVVNTSGPFIALGETVIQACLAAKCHYLDTTGEHGFMVAMKKKYAKKYEEAGLVCIPACAYILGMGTLASALVAEKEGVDTVKSLHFPQGLQTVASLQSMIREGMQKRFKKIDGSIKEIPDSEGAEEVALPWDGSKVFAGVIGGAECLFLEDDEQIKNTQTLFFIPGRNSTAGGGGNPMFTIWKELKKFVPEAMVGSWIDEYVNLIMKRPPRESDDMKWQCVGWGEGPGGVKSQAILMGKAAYVTTGVMCAEAALLCVEDKINRRGYVSIAQAFGARNFLEKIKRIVTKVEVS